MILFTFISLIDFLFESEIIYSSVLNWYSKLLVWSFGIAFLSTAYLDMRLFVPLLRKFCLVCTAYLLFQNAMWNFLGRFIPNLYDFGIIHPLNDAYSQEGLREYIIMTNLKRFGSFFSEPSFYANLMNLCILLILFDGEKRNIIQRKQVYELIFLSIGVLISTSTGGILVMIFTYVAYFILGRDIKSTMILIGGTLIAVYVLFYSSISRITEVQWFLGKVMNMDKLERVGGSYSYLSLLNTRQMIFGVGCGNTGVIVPGYMNSFATIIISYGLVGFFLFSFFVYYLWRRSNLLSRIILIIYFINSFQGAHAFSFSGLCNLSIVMISNMNGSYSKELSS